MMVVIITSANKAELLSTISAVQPFSNGRHTHRLWGPFMYIWMRHRAMELQLGTLSMAVTTLVLLLGFMRRRCHETETGY